MDKRGELQSTLRIEDVPTVRSMVAQKLREAIMSGTLKPGQRLIERELCEMTGVSRPSIREALRLLEADGLVNRTSDPNDRRSRLAVLTPAGRTAYSKGDEIRKQTEQELFGVLSPAESDTLHELLAKLQR